MNIFESKASMPVSNEGVVRVDLVPAEVSYPMRGRLSGSQNTDNSVEHAQRPRRGHGY